MRVRQLDRRGFDYRGLPNQLRDRGSPADQGSQSTYDDRDDSSPCTAQPALTHVTFTPAVPPRQLSSSAGHAYVESSSSVSTPCASGDTTRDGDPPTPTSETQTSSMDGLAFAVGLERLCIQLVNGALHPSDLCARKITSIFKERMDENGYCWKNVSKETKDFYWNEFQKHFMWNESISSVIKMAWQHKAAERYRALMCSLRRKKDKTIHVSDSTWQTWNKAWNSPEFKARSLKFTANRLTEIGGPGSGISRHTGGSISHACHAERLRSKLGREPLPYELFEVTHTRKGTSKLVDARAETIKDRYLELVMRSTQTQKGYNEAPIVNKAALYYQAVGGEKKRRVYGVGSQAFVFYPQSSQILSISTSSELLRNEIKNLHQTVDQLKDSNN